MNTPLQKAPPRPEIRGDWASKTFAGLVMGLALAFAGAGLLFHLGPPGASKMLAVMWLVAPLWLIVQSTVYLFHSGKRAWLWLGSLAVFAHAVVFLTDLVSP